MSYTEIRRKYIAKTRKPHSCEWCGSQIEATSEAWYRFYEFKGERHFTCMHPECVRACDLAHADPHQDLSDGWQDGEYQRGEWVSSENDRYPHRSTWQIIRQYEAFEEVKVGDWVHSSLNPKVLRLVEKIGVEGDLIFNYATDLELLDRDEWVLDDWSKVFPVPEIQSTRVDVQAA
jgi:hypothetical protein